MVSCPFRIMSPCYSERSEGSHRCLMISTERSDEESLLSARLGGVSSLWFGMNKVRRFGITRHFDSVFLFLLFKGT